MLPLAYNIEFSVVADLAIAVLLGIGFGFCLERAGFGSARKLTAVFYLHDMSVVKVMFTAIVTTMAGLFLLSSAGLIALTDLYIEPTSYPAQLLGGLVFGAGFVIGGYCPGTSVAASRPARRTQCCSRSACWLASWPTPSSRRASRPGSRPRARAN